MCLLDAVRRLWFYFFDRVILYPLLSWIIPKFGITFLNLGYWPNNYANDRKMIEVVRDCSETGDKDRAHYYLYEKPLSLHPEYPSFKGLRLLEVACGQGSSLKWISKAHPEIEEIVGIDRVPTKAENIVAGDAHCLPFEDSSFDIILSVEASHLFSDCLGFFKECHRVLKPGGYLCWTDLRYSQDESLLHDQVKSAKLHEISFVEITDNVLLGIEKTASKYDRMLSKAPYLVRMFTPSLRATYCAPGTHTYERFAMKEKKYFAALWRKIE